MLLPLLVSLASAEGPALTQPLLTVTCEPLEGLLRSLDQSGLAARMAQARPTRAPPWLALLDPAQAEAAGFDLGGPLRFTYAAADPGALRLEGWAEVPFSGTEAQALELLRTLTLNPRPAGGGWAVGGGDAVLVRPGPGGLLVQAGAGAPPQVPGSPAPLSALPDRGGCVLYFGVPAAAAEGGAEVGVYTAFTGDGSLELQARALLGDQPAPPGLARTAAPVVGRSSETPRLVFTLGVPVEELLRGLPERAQDRVPEWLSPRPDVLPPQATLAVFGELDQPRFVLVLGARSPRGLPVPGRRASRELEELLTHTQTPYTRLDTRTLQVELPRTVFVPNSVLVEARWGQLNVTFDAATLEELVHGGGQPWLDRGQRRFAGDQAVAVFAQSPEIGRWQLGVGVDGPLWALAAQGQPPEGGQPLTPVLEQLPPGLRSGLGSRVERGLEQLTEPFEVLFESELDTMVASICTAELAYDAAFDEFASLEPHPRPPEAVNPQAVPWAPGPEAWEYMGWEPAAPALQGSYWVELLPGGEHAAVWGVTDLDGDGVQARVRASTERGCRVESLGPPGAL